MERYWGMYPDNIAQVHAIAANLEGKTLGWLVSLHDTEAPELANLDAFMQTLQEQFKDPMAARHTETHIWNLKQGKRSLTEYIEDFRSLVSHLRDWPKRMLVCQF